MDTEREALGITSTSSLLRSMGSMTKTSGRGLLMFRVLAVSATTAAIAGLCGAYIGGIFLLGGGNMFVICSTLGWIGASNYYYRYQIAQALFAFDQYPMLMRLHLMTNFPLAKFHELKLNTAFDRQRERTRFKTNAALRDMLASSYQTAATSIDEIMTRREQDLITELAQQPMDDDNGLIEEKHADGFAKGVHFDV